MNRFRFGQLDCHGSLVKMATRKGVSLALALVCGVLLSGVGSSGEVFAAEQQVPNSQTPMTEGTQVGLDFPPLPAIGPTLDLPEVREEREALLAEVEQTELLANAEQTELIDETEYAVTWTGVTELHLDVSRARLEGEKWIEVNLSDQMLYAWDGDQLVNEFLISSGISIYPTVTGVFRMWARTPSQTMSGGDIDSGTYYSLPNVQWVQYFYAEYAFHGTYWHDNFGTPMSHGCVNLTIEDAEWLFNWTLPEWDGSGGWLRTTENDATLVWVH